MAMGSLRFLGIGRWPDFSGVPGAGLDFSRGPRSKIEEIVERKIGGTTPEPLGVSVLNALWEILAVRGSARE